MAISPVEKAPQLSPQEMFDKKVSTLELRLGEMFDNLVGSGEKAGLLRDIGSRLSKQDYSIDSLLVRITGEDGIVDPEAVLKEGDEMATNLSSTSLKDISQILLDSARLRAMVLTGGGMYKEGSFSSELHFARKIDGQIEQSWTPAIDELEEKYTQFDINSVVEEIQQNGINDERKTRLYASVLLSALKSPKVLDVQAIKKAMVEGGQIGEATAQIIDDGVLTGGEVRYAKHLTEQGILQSRMSEGKRLQRYFCDKLGFQDTADTYFETAEGELMRIVAFAEGREEDSTFGVTDTDHIWRTEGGEWKPIIVSRRTESGTSESSVATATDVSKGTIKFIDVGSGKKELRTSLTPARRILAGAPEPTDISRATSSAEIETKNRVIKRLEEVGSWPGTPIEILDTPVDVEVVENGKRKTVRMLAKTINQNSDGLRKLVDFDAVSPQAYFGEDGRLYTKLVKAFDQDGDGDANIHFVDLSEDGKTVLARSFATAVFHGTNFNILSLVQYQKDKEFKKEEGLSWMLAEHTYEDAGNENHNFTWYLPAAHRANYDEQSQNVLEAPKKKYASSGQPTTETPTVVNVSTGIRGKEAARKFALTALWEKARKGKAKEQTKLIDVELYTLPDAMRFLASQDGMRIIPRMKIISRRISNSRFYPQPQMIEVQAPEGRGFKVNEKLVSKAHVPIILQKAASDGSYNRYVDINGNIYHQDIINTVAGERVWISQVDIGNLPAVL